MILNKLNIIRTQKNVNDNGGCMRFRDFLIKVSRVMPNYISLVHSKLYYWTLFRLFFERNIQYIGQASIRIHPSTSLVFGNSKIVIDNGMLSIGFEPLLRPKGTCHIRLLNSNLYTTGNVDLRPGVGIWAQNANVKIGNGTVINGPTSIIARAGVTIGALCQIAMNTMIMDCDLHKHALAGDKPEDVAKEIIIEDHCWIGHNVTILKGVTIGEGSIIGARSVVTRDVEPHTMAAGVPARKIKDNIVWEA